MGFTRYKKYVSQEITPLVEQDGYGNISYYTSNEEINGYVPNEEIMQAIRSPVSRRYTKFYLLHEDETIKEDITENVLLNGSIESTNSSGQSRTCGLTLINEKTKVLVGFKGKDTPIYENRYIWMPVPRKDNLWYYNKIKVVNGIELYDRKYEVDEGIFVLYDTSFNFNQNQNTVALQLYDKFALLDGTLDGVADIDYQIPVNSSVPGALTSLLRLERSPGVCYDSKELLFPTKYNNEKTPYTLHKTKDNSIGDIIKDMSLMISCDYRYNDYGNLALTDTLSDLDHHYRSIVWDFKDEFGEYINPTLSVARSKIKNKVTVIGANVNGRLAKGTVENKNPYSNYNIYSEFGVKAKTFTEDLLYSDSLCIERARYELRKLLRNYITLSFQCPYIPHISPDDMIRFSNKDMGIDSGLFVVNSVSIPHNPTGMMSLTCTNVEEILEVNA